MAADHRHRMGLEAVDHRVAAGEGIDLVAHRMAAEVERDAEPLEDIETRRVDRLLADNMQADNHLLADHLLAGMLAAVGEGVVSLVVHVPAHQTLCKYPDC